MTNLLIAVHHGVWIFNALGAISLALLMTWLTTQARAEFCEDVNEARRTSGTKVEYIAVQTQTARSRLSTQFNGQAPCSFLGRLPDLPELEVALIKLRAPRHGLVVIDAAELQQLVREVMALVTLKRPVKKMALDSSPGEGRRTA